jgi:hypothetical protein
LKKSEPYTGCGALKEENEEDKEESNLMLEVLNFKIS